MKVLGGHITFPIFDGKGNVVEVYGCRINREKRYPNHIYLPGPHQGIWNREALKESQEIILCESLIDGLSFWSNGFKNVTTSYGIQGFTPSHVKAFKHFEIKKSLDCL